MTTSSSTAGILFRGYVLFSCGKFVFYTRKEDVGFLCPECGCEVVRGRLFHRPIDHDQARKIVHEDVEKCFLKRDPIIAKVRE